MFKSFSKVKLLIISLILISSFLFVGTIFAQNIGWGDVDKIAGGSGFQTNEQRAGGLTFLNTTIADVINIFLGLIGVVFVGLMVYSGYQWMTAGGEEEKVTQATTRIRNSAIGLAIVLLAFVGTKTVFTFFYQQAGDRTTGSITTAIKCTGDTDGSCPDGYECQGGTCQPMGEPDGRRCEKNADCPLDQPICEQLGNISQAKSKWVNWMNFKGWSYCICRGDSDCETSIPTKPFCTKLLGFNKCGVCTDNSKCTALGEVCDETKGECIKCSGLDRSSCLEVSSCTWGGIMGFINGECKKK